MSVNWVFSWSLWWSTIMSHSTPLSLSKECIVHCHIVCLSRLMMLPSLVSCCLMFKGDLKKFTYTVSIVFVSVLLSQSYGYIIYNILEFFSEFCVIDVGFIMALLRWDYSHRHQLIIREIVLEKKLSTLRYVCLNDKLSHSRHRFTSLTFDRNIQQIVRYQIIYSHSRDCTRVPWESLTSLVISLALINGCHHWPIIKWFLPCSTSKHCNHMDRIILFGRRDKDPRSLLSAHGFPMAAMEYFV